MALAFCTLAIAMPVSLAADGIRLLPTDFSLKGPENIQQLTVVRLVQGKLAGMVDETDLRYSVADPAVVVIKDGVAHGLAHIRPRRRELF